MWNAKRPIRSVSEVVASFTEEFQSIMDQQTEVARLAEEQAATLTKKAEAAKEEASSAELAINNFKTMFSKKEKTNA